MTFHPELINAIKNDELVIFAGAGLSWDLKNKKGEKIEGWDNLVKQLLINLKSKGYDTDHLLALAEKNYEPIQILGLLESDAEDIPKKETVEFTKQFYNLNPENTFTVHEKITELTKKIITTNYDHAFELTEDDLKLNTGYKGKVFELTKFTDKTTPSLFKLHGCHLDEGSMILFPSEYKSLYESQDEYSEQVSFELKRIIASKTILFIGCGMGDYQINSIFKKVKSLSKDFSRKHFIISTSEINSSLDFIQRVPIDNHSQVEELLDNLLQIKKESRTEENVAKLRLETEIKKMRIEKEELVAELKQVQSEEEKNKSLLKKAGLNHFEKGLQHQLDEDNHDACFEYEKGTEYFHHTAAFHNWGLALTKLAFLNKDESLFKQSFDKYKKAIDLKPSNIQSIHNWAISLQLLAGIKKDESIFEQSFNKFQQVLDLNAHDEQTLNSWGNAYYKLALIKKDESVFQKCFTKYEESINLNPVYDKAYFNWGRALYSFAEIKKDENIFSDCISKYEKAFELNSQNAAAAFGLASTFNRIAVLKKDKNLFQKSFDYFQKTIDLEPENAQGYYNWSSSLLSFFQISKDKKLLLKAKEKSQIAYELGHHSYNLSCAHSQIKNKEEALKYLEESLSKNEVSISHVQTDVDWKNYWEDEDFKTLIEKYSKQ